MSKVSKELLRDYVNEQNFASPDDILNAIKEMFRDVLQELLEAEWIHILVMIRTIYHGKTH